MQQVGYRLWVVMVLVPVGRGAKGCNAKRMCRRMCLTLAVKWYEIGEGPPQSWLPIQPREAAFNQGFPPPPPTPPSGGLMAALTEPASRGAQHPHPPMTLTPPGA